MLKIKLLKSDQKGFSHHFILPLIVITVIAGIGTYIITKSKAATSGPVIAQRSQIRAFSSGKCLENDNGTKALGNLIVIRPCDAKKPVSQLWTIMGDRSLRNANGYCLDTQAGIMTPGTKIVMRNCTGNVDQQWVIFTADQTIRNPLTGLCLANEAGSSQVIIDRCAESKTQQHWNAAIYTGQKLPSVPTVPKKIAPTAGATSRFTVGTFNVLGYHYTIPGSKSSLQNYPGFRDGITRIDWAVKMFEENKLDVVGLQEFEPEQYGRVKAIYAGDTTGNWLIYPTPMRQDTNNVSTGAIMWRKNKFTMIASGHRLISRANFTDKDGNEVTKDAEAPWVKLKENSTGKVFYVTNIHDAVTTPTVNNAQTRVANETENLADIKKKLADAPVIATGDFNSGFSWDATRDAGIPKTSITYCILTQGGFMTNAYDISRYIKAGVQGEYFSTTNRTTIPACPSSSNPDRSDVDHIYVSNKVNVLNWIVVPGETDPALRVSDHKLHYSSVSIQ